MSLTTASGFLTLSFTGIRLDYPFNTYKSLDNSSTSFEVPFSGNFNNDTLQLDTSNPAMPSFTYVNGSKFSWVPEYGPQYPDGPWQPLADGVSRGENTTKKPNNAPALGAWSSWAWSWWILGLLGVVAFI